MRVGFVEWPEGLQPNGSAWLQISEQVHAAGLDLLVTNELPFGPWIAQAKAFDQDAAQRSVDLHATGLRSLSDLPVAAIISSRPVWSGERLANEAIVIDGGRVQAFHRKQYFPEEPGWFEATWYRAGHDPFPVISAAGLRIGVLLCTEAMFNEHPRSFGKRQVDLIAIPRATGASAIWRTAGQMAAIVSGSYVVSSNRAGSSGEGRMFGGDGFAFAPDGGFMTSTAAGVTLAAVDIDTMVSARQRDLYPCYVVEAGLH